MIRELQAWKISQEDAGRKKTAVYQVKCTLGSKGFSAGTLRTEKKAQQGIKNRDREAKGRDMTKVTHLCDFRELFHRLLVETLIYLQRFYHMQSSSSLVSSHERFKRSTVWCLFIYRMCYTQECLCMTENNQTVHLFQSFSLKKILLRYDRFIALIFEAFIC